MEEIWKDVVGYEGLYQVSNFGNVKSLKYNHTVKEKNLNPGVTNSGYYHVGLCKNRIRKNMTVHQLVAVAFLNHVVNGHKLVINHKDFDKLNNRTDNLEIVTGRENSNQKHIKSSSVYTGVSWHKQHKKWMSYIVINGKLKHLGYFVDEMEASLAYQHELKLIG